MKITDEQLVSWFQFHTLTERQQDALISIRGAGLALARTIVLNCPEGADATDAVRKVREAVATANVAIACAPPEPDKAVSA